MAEASSRALFTGAEVVHLLTNEDSNDERDVYDGMDDVFFPGSDDELGFMEEEIGDERLATQDLYIRSSTWVLPNHSDGEGDDEGDNDGVVNANGSLR